MGLTHCYKTTVFFTFILSKEVRSYKWSRTYSETNKAKFLHELGKTDWDDGAGFISDGANSLYSAFAAKFTYVFETFFSSKKDLY